MTHDRNTLLKLNSTGEYIAWNEVDGFHLTMDRSFARPFTEDEIREQQNRLNQKLDREDWIIQLWKEQADQENELIPQIDTYENHD